MGLLFLKSEVPSCRLRQLGTASIGWKMSKPNPGRRKREKFDRFRSKRSEETSMANQSRQQPSNTPFQVAALMIAQGLAARRNAVIAALYGTFLLIIGVLTAIAAAWVLRWTPEDSVPEWLLATLMVIPAIILIVIAVIGLVGGTVVLIYYWRHREDGDSTETPPA